MKKKTIIFIILVLLISNISIVIIFSNKKGNLTYTYYKEDRYATVGWSGNKPEGELIIPYRCDKGYIVKYINETDFNNCPKLTSIVIEADLIKIPRGTFKDCFNVEKIKLKKLGKPSYSGGSYLDYIFYGENSSKSLDAIKEVEITEGTTIYEGAFIYCMSLEKIILPETITEIERFAFWGCSNLKSINLPNSIKSIDTCAFVLCLSLEKIILPEKLSIIKELTFYYCRSLTEIIIPDNIKTIGGSAFARCYNLKNVILPDELNTIRDKAFYYCQSLEKIILPNSLQYLGYNVFTGCTKLNIYCEFSENDKKWNENWNCSLPVHYNQIEN